MPQTRAYLLALATFLSGLGAGYLAPHPAPFAAYTQRLQQEEERAQAKGGFEPAYVHLKKTLTLAEADPSACPRARLEAAWSLAGTRAAHPFDARRLDELSDRYVATLERLK
jgi:hypothetical protein